MATPSSAAFFWMPDCTHTQCETISVMETGREMGGGGGGVDCAW